MQSTLNEPSPDAWEELSPLIDDAIGKLGAKDRDALVLRFFDGKSMQEIGAVLGASEDAAKMRVSRALERIRKMLQKHGVDCATSILAKELSSHSICMAPAALANSATILAVTKGATASTSTLTLIKGASKIMAWTKAKTAVTTAVILALTATSVTGYKVVQAHHPIDLLVSTTEVGADGIVRSQLRLEMVNRSGQTIPANSQISAFSGAEIDEWTDETGQNVNYSKQPGTYDTTVFTNMNKYVVTLNHPVPPGGKIIWIQRDEIDGQKVIHSGQSLIQPTGIPGEFQLTDHEEYGFPDTLHAKGIVHLPPGAVLLEQTAGFTVMTNQGQVELHFDAMLRLILLTAVFAIGCRPKRSRMSQTL